MLGDLRDAFGLSYLFISHDLAVVAQLADRIAVMYRGGLCETGSTPDVLQRPYHPYRQALLAAVPQIRADRVLRAGRRVAAIVAAGADDGAGCRFRARCPHKIGAICETVRPPLRRLLPSHSVACHLEAPPA